MPTKRISDHPPGSWEWFSDYFIPEPNSGCFLWIHGSWGQRAKYGCIQYNGSSQQAHRVAWLIANGDIPPGMWVLHKCDNGICVNPRHLFLGTSLDNIMDMVAKGRNSNGNVLKTECPRGHRYDAVKSNGKRFCRKCNTESCRNGAMRRRERK